ncbi:hypothetical protein ACFL1H_03255, partial [Nanoarchaeota archaeon]
QAFLAMNFLKLGYRRKKVNGSSMDIVDYVNLERIQSDELNDKLYGMSHQISLKLNETDHRTLLSGDYTDDKLMKIMVQMGYHGEVPSDIKNLFRITVDAMKDFNSFAIKNDSIVRIYPGSTMEHCLDRYHENIFGHLYGKKQNYPIVKDPFKNCQTRI